jgi:hypothetical protein
MKSQTFINPNTGSLPSLIGITLGLTIPNAILARNLGSSLALQAVNTASLSAGSGIAGGISGRETAYGFHTTRIDHSAGRPSDRAVAVRQTIGQNTRPY